MEITRCRICLAKNIRTKTMEDIQIQRVYDKFTENLYLKQNTPLVACYICYAQLKNSHRLMVKCQQSEELFAQIINDTQLDNSLLDGSIPKFNNLSISLVQQINIIDHEDSVKLEPAIIDLELKDVTTKEPSTEADPLNPKQVTTSASTSILYEDDVKPEIKLEDYDGVELCTEFEDSKDYLDHKENNDKTPDCKDEHNFDVLLSKEIKITKKRSKSRKIKKEKLHKKRSSSKTNNNDKGNDATRTGRRKMGIKPFKCDVCQRSFTYKTLLINHIRIHEDEQPFKCDKCFRSFRTKNSLFRHIRTHTGERPYKCDVCQKRFTVDSTLRKHIRIHTGEKPYKCDICQKTFNQQSALKSHIYTHTGEKPYKCQICQASFSQTSNLKTHMRKHSGEKPYKCDICQSTFTQQSSLEKHIRIHTEEKPYKCHICQKSFTQKGTMKIHIRNHTGEKPYKCDICQSSFKMKRELNRHAQIHSGGKSFKCDLCTSSFTDRSNFVRHIRKHEELGQEPFVKESPS